MYEFHIYYKCSLLVIWGTEVEKRVFNQQYFVARCVGEGREATCQLNSWKHRSPSWTDEQRFAKHVNQAHSAYTWWSFPMLKYHLGAEYFRTDAEVQSAVNEFFWKKNPTKSAMGISQLIERYTNCLERVGDHVEK